MQELLIYWMIVLYEYEFWACKYIVKAILFKQLGKGDELYTGKLYSMRCFIHCIDEKLTRLLKEYPYTDIEINCFLK